MSDGIGGFALEEPICPQSQLPLIQWYRPDKRYLENGLHLIQLSPGVLSRKHLDDQTTNTPYVGFLRVRDLLDHLGGHPVDGAL
jgi:hypothetical protein